MVNPYTNRYLLDEPTTTSQKRPNAVPPPSPTHSVLAYAVGAVLFLMLLLSAGLAIQLYANRQMSLSMKQAYQSAQALNHEVLEQMDQWKLRVEEQESERKHILSDWYSSKNQALGLKTQVTRIQAEQQQQERRWSKESATLKNSLQSALTEKINANTAASSILLAKQTKLDQLQQANQDLNHVAAESQQQAQNLASEAAALERQKQDLSCQLGRTETNNQELCNKIYRLQHSLTAAEADNSQLSNRVIGLKRELCAARSQQSCLERKIGELERVLGKLRK